jgi:hypothetical protein
MENSTSRLTKSLGAALAALIIAYLVSLPIAKLFGDSVAQCCRILLGFPLGWLLGGGVPRVLAFPGWSLGKLVIGFLIAAAVVAAAMIFKARWAELIAGYLAAGIKLAAFLIIFAGIVLILQRSDLTTYALAALVIGTVVCSIPTTVMVWVLAFLTNYVLGRMIREL